MGTRRRRIADGWALVAIARDAATAEQWQALLVEHGIDAHVRVAEPERAGMVGRGTTPVSFMEDASMLSYAVYVEQSDREAARALLEGRSGLGPMRLDRTTLLGTFGVLGGTLLLVVVLALEADRGSCVTIAACAHCSAVPSTTASTAFGSRTCRLRPCPRAASASRCTPPR